MDLVTVEEAAARLKVSTRRVRAMLADKILLGENIGGRWFVDPASITLAGHRTGQPMSPRIAWALAALAEGDRPTDLGSSSELSRLRRRWDTLRAEPDPIDYLRSALARRSERSIWDGPEPEELLRDDRVLPTGPNDRRAGMASGGSAQVCVKRSDLEDLAEDHLLVPTSRTSNVIVHAVEDHLWPKSLPWLILVADLADGGPRERQQARIIFRERAHA